MNTRTCTVEGCDKPHRAKGLCYMHYRRVKSTGTLERYGVPTDPYANTDMKTCRACGEAKPRTDYTRNGMAADGLKGRCKSCENTMYREKYATDEEHRLGILARSRKFKYGMDGDAINKLHAFQHGKCALCSTELGTDLRKFHIDHDHKTNEARGLLCHRCNRALGFFEDDVENFYRAARYLLNPPMRRMAREKAI